MATTDTKKVFIDAFHSLSQRFGGYSVWRDFVTMSACSISNRFDGTLYDERENEYMKIVGRYEKNDIDKFVTMLGMTIKALHENPRQDFLGTIFGELGLSNSFGGQFFTPYHVGELMAKIDLADAVDTINEGKVASIADPCCGAGCLMIAAVNELRARKVDVEKRVVFSAQDIDAVTAMMCYIQLSLLDASAIVKVGDSLADPITTDEDLHNPSIWLTPSFLKYHAEVAA